MIGGGVRKHVLIASHLRIAVEVQHEFDLIIFVFFICDDFYQSALRLDINSMMAPLKLVNFNSYT